MDDISQDDTSSFDLDISVGNDGSSTPMNSSFLSPLKKLDNLNLNNLSDISENDYDIGNKTIEETTDESQEETEETEETEGTEETATETGGILQQKPVFVNKRKRANVSDIEMVLTPISNSVSSSYHSSNHDNQNMSICSNVTSTSLSNLKLSFSNSDSTPCPVPAKKRLRFSDQNTPINKKKLLDFSHSVKTNVNDLTYDLRNSGKDANIHIYNDEHYDSDEHYSDNDNDDYNDNYTHGDDIHSNIQSTPISQSTPSNSRVSSPTSSKSAPSSSPDRMESDLGVGESIDESVGRADESVGAVDESFVDDTRDSRGESVGNDRIDESERSEEIIDESIDDTLPKHAQPAFNSNFVTPTFESRKTINGYTLINQEVTEDIHIADQRITEASDEDQKSDDDYTKSDILNNRINDPYLTEPKSSNISIRLAYMNDKYKLPLLQDQQRLTKIELLQLITPDNVLEFYQQILLADEQMRQLLRTERIKWHPDKWANVDTDMDIINAVSQAINALVNSTE